MCLKTKLFQLYGQQCTEIYHPAVLLENCIIYVEKVHYIHSLLAATDVLKSITFDIGISVWSMIHQRKCVFMIFIIFEIMFITKLFIHWTHNKCLSCKSQHNAASFSVIHPAMYILWHCPLFVSALYIAKHNIFLSQLYSLCWNKCPLWQDYLVLILKHLKHTKQFFAFVCSHSHRCSGSEWKQHF